MQRSTNKHCIDLESPTEEREKGLDELNQVSHDGGTHRDSQPEFTEPNGCYTNSYRACMCPNLASACMCVTIAQLGLLLNF